MIIDCHGHYTTAPKSLEAFRQKQIDSLKDARLSPAKDSLIIRDDEIRDSIEGAQLRIQRERMNGRYFSSLDEYSRMYCLSVDAVAKARKDCACPAAIISLRAILFPVASTVSEWLAVSTSQVR